jgi:hypothetical protein
MGADLPYPREGKAPDTAQESDAYETLSWSRDMTAFLKACFDETPGESLMRSNIAQFIDAVQSFCGESEDAKMEDILDLIQAEPDSVVAAKEIRNAITASQPKGYFDIKAKSLFENTITKLVKGEIASAEYFPHEEEWDFICVSIKDTGYSLDLNYDWKSVQISASSTGDRNKDIEGLFCSKMTDWTHCQNQKKQDDTPIFAVYGKSQYPGLEAVDEALYFYRLYKEYSERPQEVANRIIAIVRELESVNGKVSAGIP